MNPKRALAALSAVAAVACSSTSTAPDRCADCAPGAGEVRIAVTMSSADVSRVVATVTAPDLAAPISQQLSPAAAPSGTLYVPAGTGRVVTLEAYAPAPEDAIVVYRGTVTTDVAAGQSAPANVVLRPVVKDVAVSAAFPGGDLDLPRVRSVAVTVSGARIQGSATWYLALDAASGVASGTAAAVPVGASRTIRVTSFDAGGVALHQGAIDTAVLETATSGAAVTLASLSGTGAIPISGGFCTPGCTARFCGDDGCGGSCGGCEPGVSCDAGVCGGAALAAGWTDAALIGPGSRPNAPKRVWGNGPDDVWTSADEAFHHWDGRAWTAMAAPEYFSLTGIWGNGASDVWAVGVAREDVWEVKPLPHRGEPYWGTGIVHWNGTAWSQVIAREGDALLAVWGSAANDVWAGGGQGPFLHWDGSAWSSVARDDGLIVNAIWGTAADDVWSVGDNVIRHWNGSTWSSVSLDAGVYLWDVYGFAANDVWAVGNDQEPNGKILHWNGSAWTTTTLGSAFYSVWGAGPRDVWAGSWSGALAHWDGTRWSIIPTSTAATGGIWDLWGTGASDIWAAGWDPESLGTGVILHYGE